MICIYLWTQLMLSDYTKILTLFVKFIENLGSFE